MFNSPEKQPNTPQSQAKEAEKKSQLDKRRENIRYEQIKQLSEQERKDRVTRKLEKLKESRDKEKAKKGRREKESKKPLRKHYQRIASRLLSNVEAGILVEDKAKERAPAQRLAFEAEATLDKLFRVFNSKEYHISIRAQALQDAMTIHRKAHASLEAAIKKLEIKRGRDADEQLELDFLQELKKDSTVKYKDKVTQLEDMKANGQVSQETPIVDSLDPEDANIKEIMQRASEIEAARKEKLVPSTYDQKAIGLKRVANYRKLRKINKEFQESRPDQIEKREQLKAEKEAILYDQIEQLAKTTVETKTEPETESNPTKVLELIGKASESDLNQILDRYSESMLSSEYGNWLEIRDKRNMIKRLNNKLTGLSLAGMMPEQIQAKIKSMVLSDEEMRLVELLSNPEITGRLRVFYADQMKENTPTNISAVDFQADILSEMQDYERWRLEGDKADRFAAASEDFVAKLMDLQEEDFTDEDLSLTLASYNLARKVDNEWQYDSEYKDRIKSMVEKAEEIRKQYLSAQAILPESDDSIVGPNTATKVIDAIESDISSGMTELSDLFRAGVVDVLPTNTGVSIVINSYNILNGKDGDPADPALKESLTNLAFELMHKLSDESPEEIAKLKTNALEKATLNGLGVTFKKHALTNFNTKFRKEFVDGVTPAVNLLVLPNRDDYIKQQLLLMAHEQSDYIVDQLLIPQPGTQSKEEEAVREIVSRLFDGKISAETLTDLQDVYLTEGDEKKSADQDLQRQNIFKLIKISEEILKANKPGTVGDAKYSYDYLTTDMMIRQQLAMDIIGQIQKDGFESINLEFIQELGRKYEVKLPKFDLTKWYIEEGKQDRSKGINGLSRDKFTYSADVAYEPLIGPLGDDTNPFNTAHQEAVQRGMYIGVDKPPPMYGGSGGAHYDVWEYNVDGRMVPLKYWLPRIPIITPVLNRTPIVKNIVGAVGSIPLSPKFLTQYEFRRGIGARLYRSKNPRLRDLGKYYVGSDYLGANPSKYFKYMNPQYEGLAKHYLEGVQKAFRVDEGRERMPVSLQMDVEEFTHKKGIQWMAAIMGEGGVGQIKGMRFLGELLGTKFDFDPMTNQYKFKRDENKMRDTQDLVADVIEKKHLINKDRLKKLEEKATDKSGAIDEAALYELKANEILQKPLMGAFGEGDKKKGEARYVYEHHAEGQFDDRILGIKQKRKVTPWIGSRQGFARMVNPMRRFWGTKPGKLQKKAADYYSKYVTRSRLPGQDAEKIGWHDQIGSKFKDFLEKRDGYVALMTLKDEHEHFAEHNILDYDDDGNPTVAENYSLYSIVNMIHIAEDIMRGDQAGAWAVAEEDTTLEFTERGKKQKIEIRKGENLVDQNGNLISRIFEEGKHFDIIDNKVVLKDDNAMKPKDRTEVKKYWGRMVGDRLNPHLRFMRINSESGREKAVEWFGGDANIDEGFDENNVLLRTDFVKNAILGLQMEVLVDVLGKGLPPDRRYDMERDQEGKDIIKFKEGYEYTTIQGETKAMTKAFTESPDTGEMLATEEFKDYLMDRIFLSYHYKLGEGKDPRAHPSYQKIARQIQNNSLTQEDVTKIIAGEVGPRHNPLIDDLFKETMDFKVDKQPSWTNPYRQELEAVPPRPIKELTTLERTLKSGFDTFRGRYEYAQMLMDQWMVAVRKVAQYERIGYEKAGYYKGISKWIKRLTNQGMVAGIVLAGFGSPLGIMLALSMYGIRNFARPAANKNAKKWHARRLKSIDRFKEISGMDGVFQAAAQGEIPTQYDLKRMMYYTELVTFWLEDLADTDPPDDWYPDDDLVLKKSGDLFNQIDDKLSEWSQKEIEV